MAIAVPQGARERIRPALEGSGEYGGYSPADLASAYKLPAKGGSGQTIAIVDAYDDPKAESDLAVYREHYGLPPCTTASGCFKKVNQKGESKNYPEGEYGWGTEISLDLDVASAICPECHLLLVEANDSYGSSLYPAENEAALLGATAISNSWAANESEEETADDVNFHHPGIPITASSGDNGYGLKYPAASPYVIAVGGTSLRKDSGTRGWAEGAWIGAGSGCSKYEPKPAWQKDAKCSNRMVSDVSAVADPQTGVSIYDSYEWSGWDVFGGTSASAPIIAGIEALSSSTTRAAGPEAFYKGPAWLYDVTTGANGTCTPPSENEYFCTGELGYDGPTGNGTPGFAPTGKPSVASRLSSVGITEAELQGTINPEGSETKYHFEYGPTTSYGQSQPTSDASVGSGTANVTVSGKLIGLPENQLYHYRLVAVNTVGTTYGEDHTFATRGAGWPPLPIYNMSFGSTYTGVYNGTEGTGNGQFRSTMSVAVNPLNGTVVVIGGDGDGRVQVFSEAGKYLRQFGGEGEGNGKLKNPLGVTVDSKGNVWVADTQNNRLEEFSEAGEFIRTVGSKGNENGQLNSPGDVAVDSKDNVWVADRGNHRIQEFSPTGAYLGKISTWVSEPSGITVDSSQNVWITTNGGVVQEYTASGSSVLSFGSSGSKDNQLFFPSGIDVDSNGNVWVADSFNQRIKVFSSSGQFEEKFGHYGIEPSDVQYPSDVALDPRGNVWVASGENPRVAQWKIPSPWPPAYSTSFGSAGTGNGQFSLPTGIAVNPKNGMLVALDSGHHRIQEFTKSGEFIRAFGSQGKANGQLEDAVGVAVDSKGNVWVADTQNNRIQEFSETGQFIRSVGSLGAGNGAFNQPWGVAVDRNGNVWVADTENYRIQEFSETGTYLFQTAVGEPLGIAIDSKGNVWTSSAGGKIEERTEAGELVRSFSESGSGPGQLHGPAALAVDPKGNVWVADTDNSRIEIFSENGEYLTTASGQFQFPYGLALDAYGNAWVTDRVHGHVERWYVRGVPAAVTQSASNLTATGIKLNGTVDPRGLATTYYFEYGTTTSYGTRVPTAGEGVGSGVEALTKSQSLSGLKDGTTYHFRIVASNSLGITYGEDKTFTTPKLPKATTEPATNVKTISATLNGLVNAESTFSVYQFEYGKTTSYGTKAPAEANYAFGSSYVPVSEGISSLEASTTYHYRLEATNQYGTVYGADKTFTTLGAPTYQSAFGTAGAGNGQFAHPAGSAVDASGNLWVVDENNKRVQKFNENGEYLAQFGSAGSGNGQFGAPTDIAIDSKGNLWVTDAGNSRVEEFNPSGEYLAKFGSVGSGNGQFAAGGPESIAIDSSGNIWVADTYNGRLQKFNEKGEFVKVVSSKGSGAGQLGEPTGIDIGVGNTVWVADWQYNRLVKFNQAGEYLGQFGSEGTGNGQFKHPDVIEVDSVGGVWVGDQNNSRVQELTEAGKYVIQFGTSGKGLGQFSFTDPMGISVDAKGNLWVSDSNNNRVQRWK